MAATQKPRPVVVGQGFASALLLGGDASETAMEIATLKLALPARALTLPNSRG